MLGVIVEATFKVRKRLVKVARSGVIVDPTFKVLRKMGAGVRVGVIVELTFMVSKKRALAAGCTASWRQPQSYEPPAPSGAVFPDAAESTSLVSVRCDTLSPPEPNLRLERGTT